MNRFRVLLSLCVLCVLCGEPAFSSPPVASYVFPAGGQRGTTVPVRVGGLFLHDKCRFALDGAGLNASPTLGRAKPLWFEGPVLPLPDSQQQEDYPADMSGTVGVAKDATVGPRRGWLFTSQGGTGGLVFVVGDLPEVVETEADGDPLAERVALPVTANGRVFPRDDLDLWEFDAAAGQTVTATALAKSLNSPLVPKLDILDSAGRVLAENMTHPVAGADESVRFTAPAAGRYRVRVGDARGQGGQAYVYRLTLTTAVVPDFHFPLRVTPDGLKDVTATKEVVTAPVALNGRIPAPGAADEWRVALKKGAYTLDLLARRADSPLCGVVTVTDAAGKEVARGEAADPSADPTVAVVAPADGTYTVRVAERFRTRGGPNFAYRLRITDATAAPPGFRLTLLAENRQPPVAPDAVVVLRGATTKVRVGVERTGGFAGPVVLSALALPAGVTAKPVTVAANQATGELALQAETTAAPTTVPLSVVGTGHVGLGFPAVVGLRAAVGSPVAVAAVVPGSRFLPESPTAFLTVGVPTPFKLVDEFVMASAPRGEIYRRKYRVERDPGFDGPIEVRLADRQARHLQGVSGPVVTVSPGQTEFDYPAYLPPWMELGRTCRVCVMATARVKDAGGAEHAVAFGATGQNQQMIVVVGPGRLDLGLEKQTIRAAAGGGVRVPVRVTRGRDLTGDVKLEVVIPAHWTGVTAAPATIPAGGSTGEVVVTFAAGGGGPFNMPLVVRGTVATGSTPVVAEAKLEVVK